MSANPATAFCVEPSVPRPLAQRSGVDRDARVRFRTLGALGNSALLGAWFTAIGLICVLMTLVGCAGAGPSPKQKSHDKWDAQRAALKYELASAELRQGKSDKARGLAQEALGLGPDNPANHALLAQTYIASGEFRAAEQILTTALMEHPNAAPAWYMLGALHEREREWDLASSDFEKACEADPANIDYCVALAQALAEAGKVDQAAAALAARASKFNAEPKFHLARAELARRQHDLPRAIEGYEAALRLGLDDAAARLNLGLCLYWSGQAAQALPYLEPEYARHAAPDENGACAYVAALLATDRARSALDWLSDTSRTLPDSARLTALHAQAQAALGDFEAALKAAHRAQKLDPQLVEAHLIAGAIAAKLERKEQALAAIEQALRVESENTETWAIYAQVLERFGESNSAAMARERLAVLTAGQRLPA